ncbi:hypothetical protein AVEN_217168-1 [Araneus ventricosus]|uniref:Uncharacterized protein n=1 Tax=Araneus ventricosus TaxID=182803 RepID=A0A4Y2GNY6_ARAVE|nr:hypothetical protein AVEN_217168-1 [Araneus ventricosus]
MPYSFAASSLSQLVTAISNSFLTSKTLTAQRLFQFKEKMEIARSMVRTIGWMIKNFPSELIQQFLSCSSSVRVGIVVKKHNSSRKYSSLPVLDCPP